MMADLISHSEYFSTRLLVEPCTPVLYQILCSMQFATKPLQAKPNVRFDNSDII